MGNVGTENIGTENTTADRSLGERTLSTASEGEAPLFLIPTLSSLHLGDSSPSIPTSCDPTTFPVSTGVPPTDPLSSSPLYPSVQSGGEGSGFRATYPFGAFAEGM